MKVKIILSFTILFVLISFGCSDKEIVATYVPNTSPIEHLAFTTQGCQSSSLAKTNSVGWSYTNDSLRISVSFWTQCAARFTKSVEATDDLIEIYLTDSSVMTAKCSCLFKETIIFYAESPKRIKVIIYYRSNSSKEFELMETKSIEI